LVLHRAPLEWSGQNPYSPEAYSDLTVALMDKLGIQRAVLVGHSAGGTISVLTALRHPERVQALVLVDPAIYPGQGSPDWLLSLAVLPQVQHWGPYMVRQIATDGLSIIYSAWHNTSKITPAVIEGYTKPLRAENGDRALWEQTVANRPLGLDKQLDGIRVPVLVITGDDDRLVPVEQHVRLGHEIANATLVVIPNCGHVPHEEWPQEFVQAITVFLERL
jgi:pimeloyl-ACP methyl ester carboxylesterase